MKMEPLLLAMSIHEDKSDNFGWIRACVNDEPVTTEAQLNHHTGEKE
jgi:hypothetical protein